ncbi:MAG TPA: YggS family pyridoxal phosphate-dependent enzyme [Desulfobacterales bacterium]|nr:YggS family pyridoxal phosphate-dependent enzyme [Desulfobacterales bacterium]
MTETIATCLEHVRARISAAAQACGRRGSDVNLVAVTKTFPAEAIREAVAGGAAHIGENYIQEARDKFEQLHTLPVRWHFIGHLQSNKARYAVRMFDLIHTVDSLRLAVELDQCARKLKKRQAVLVQVNVAGEATKSGVAPEEALPLVRGIGELEHIAVRGLMTLPPFFNEPETVRPFFAALRQLRDRLRAEALPNVEMEELSMGMTGDFEAAIAEGATLVRIGTAIFGGRS